MISFICTELITHSFDCVVQTSQYFFSSVQGLFPRFRPFRCGVRCLASLASHK